MLYFYFIFYSYGVVEEPNVILFVQNIPPDAPSEALQVCRDSFFPVMVSTATLINMCLRELLPF